MYPCAICIHTDSEQVERYNNCVLPTHRNADLKVHTDFSLCDRRDVPYTVTYSFNSFRVSGLAM